MNKTPEQKLKESEAKYRLITDNANDLIHVLNDKYEIEYINEEVHKKIMGYSKNDLLGKFGLDFIHPDDFQKANEALQKGFLNGEGIEEIRLKHKEGYWIWFEIKGNIFIDVDGEEKAIIISRDISERKMTEQKLKESEAKYRLITDNANDLISVIDENFRHEYINEEVHMKIVGYSREDLIGLSPVNYVHPEDIKKAVSAWRAAVISGEESVDIRYKKKDGTWIWLEIRGKKFTDLNGKPKGIIISRDITKRKKAEQKLIESEKLLSTVLENSPDTILMIDHNDIIRYVNHIPQHFMKEPTIGKNFYEILMPENQDMYKQTFKKIFESGISKTLDIPGFAGTWCTTRFVPIYSEDHVNSIMLIITNITELKKAHEKIAQNNTEKKNSNG